jgi:F-type H+-transporting ATPase subunit b
MGSILAALHINGTLLAQVVDFVLLLAFLRIFAWPPLVQAMEARRERIAADLAAAEDERQEAVRLREQQKADLDAAKAQAQEILERAQRAADEQARQIVHEARTQAERLQQQVREEIGREREAAVAALRAEVAELVLEAAGKLMRARLNAPEDRRLVEEFIATAEAGSGR